MAADAPPGDAAPAAWQRRFEGVSPGSTLRIDLQQAPADLVIAVGEHEAIELHASEASLLAEQQPHDHPGSSLGKCTSSALARLCRACFCWEPSSMMRKQQQLAPHRPHRGHCSPPAAVAVSLGAAAAPAAAPLQLRARGPSRFLTVEATTGGGSVSVEVVQEGSLRLSTGGGSISVPKVRRVAALVMREGGGDVMPGASLPALPQKQWLFIATPSGVD